MEGQRQTVRCFTIALRGWFIRFHTLYDVFLNVQDDNDDV